MIVYLNHDASFHNEHLIIKQHYIRIHILQPYLLRNQPKAEE